MPGMKVRKLRKEGNHRQARALLEHRSMKARQVQRYKGIDAVTNWDAKAIKGMGDLVDLLLQDAKDDNQDASVRNKARELLLARVWPLAKTDREPIAQVLEADLDTSQGCITALAKLARYALRGKLSLDEASKAQGLVQAVLDAHAVQGLAELRAEIDELRQESAGQNRSIPGEITPQWGRPGRKLLSN